MVKKLMSKLRQIRNKYVAKKVLDNKKLSDTLGARAIQGKAYIPGPDDGNDDISNHEE